MWHIIQEQVSKVVAPFLLEALILAGNSLSPWGYGIWLD
jgi:hypothetical protein